MDEANTRLRVLLVELYRAAWGVAEELHRTPALREKAARRLTRALRATEALLPDEFEHSETLPLPVTQRNGT